PVPGLEATAVGVEVGAARDERDAPGPVERVAVGEPERADRTDERQDPAGPDRQPPVPELAAEGDERRGGVSHPPRPPRRGGRRPAPDPRGPSPRPPAGPPPARPPPPP